MGIQHQRKSAAQKDALLPPVEPSVGKASLRLSAAQRNSATPAVVTDLATELLDSTPVQAPKKNAGQKDDAPVQPSPPEPEESKPKQGFEASFVKKKKPCNNCPDEES